MLNVVTGIVAKRKYFDVAVAHSVDVLNHLHETFATAAANVFKSERVAAPCPDLSALFEAAQVSFMVIEKTHVQTIRYSVETEKTCVVKIVVETSTRSVVNVTMEKEQTVVTVATVTVERVRVPQRPPKVLLGENHKEKT